MKRIEGKGYVLELKDGHENDRFILVIEDKNYSENGVEYLANGEVFEKVSLTSGVLMRIAEDVYSTFHVSQEYVETYLSNILKESMRMWKENSWHGQR